MAQQGIHENLLKKQIKATNERHCSMGPKKNAYRHKGNLSHSYDISQTDNQMFSKRFTPGVMNSIAN
mgnify:CR=1 FL=1